VLARIVHQPVERLPAGFLFADGVDVFLGDAPAAALRVLAERAQLQRTVQG